MPNDAHDRRRQRRAATDAELDELAEITPADVADAQNAWHQDAPSEVKDLLDATSDDAVIEDSRD